MSEPRIAAFPDNAPPAGDRIIAVASGKGGVGKTWFSVSLCHAFARESHRTLLFDGDLGLANVDIQLGLMPARDLGAVFEGEITLKGSAQRFAPGGFDIIAGRSGSGSLASLSSHRLAEISADLLAMAEDYDRVVLDLAAGIDRQVRQLAVQAATVLVVTTDEPTALTDAYALIKVLTARKPESDVRVIVNKAQTRHEGERTYATLLRACETFLKISPPLAGIVREDRRVREAIRAQVPLLTRSPNCQAADDIEAIAAPLAGLRRKAV
ncbi:MAG: MinD/ParA family protein [Azospirillaceae bacterium]